MLPRRASSSAVSIIDSAMSAAPPAARLERSASRSSGSASSSRPWAERISPMLKLAIETLRVSPA